jgi:hypothetical protein
MNTIIDSQKAIRATVITAEVGFTAAVIVATVISAGVLLFMIMGA